MKIYFGTPSFGWRMYGIGYKSLWFLGFSMQRKESIWSQVNDGKERSNG